MAGIANLSMTGNWEVKKKDMHIFFRNSSRSFQVKTGLAP
jgi:hypothetical protein